MLNMQTTEYMISLLTFFIAYAAAVTVAGSFRAWVAEKMGDDTASSLGFASLNPLVHIDFVGSMILLFSFTFSSIFFGWGRNVPIDQYNIAQPNRWLKLLAAYFSDTIAYIVSALISVVCLLLALGSQMFMVTLQMLVYRQALSHSFLLTSCPSFTTMSITISFIVISFAYLCVLLGALTFIINGMHVALIAWTDSSGETIEPNFYQAILAPMVLILFFSEFLREGIIKFIALVAGLIGSLFGII